MDSKTWTLTQEVKLEMELTTTFIQLTTLRLARQKKKKKKINRIFFSGLTTDLWTRGAVGLNLQSWSHHVSRESKTVNFNIARLKFRIQTPLRLQKPSQEFHPELGDGVSPAGGSQQEILTPQKIQPYLYAKPWKDQSWCCHCHQYCNIYPFPQPSRVSWSSSETPPSLSHTQLMISTCKDGKSHIQSFQFPLGSLEYPILNWPCHRSPTDWFSWPIKLNWIL